MTKRGYSVVDVAAREVVSADSSYKRVKAVSPKTEKQSGALQAKSEVLRLRAQLRRREEQHDILKKPLCIQSAIATPSLSLR